MDYLHRLRYLRARHFMHLKCHLCPKLPFRTEVHATWDCPLRFWDVFEECQGFNRDGSRDPAQWQGENFNRNISWFENEQCITPIYPVLLVSNAQTRPVYESSPSMVCS